MNKLLINVAVLLVCVSLVAALDLKKAANKAGNKVGDAAGDIDIPKPGMPSITGMMEGQIWKSKLPRSVDFQLLTTTNQRLTDN